MKIIQENDVTILVADEGMVLTTADLDIFAEEVSLGMYDSIENWIEVEKIQAHIQD